jgi:preprotein translocase subunit SecA
VPGGQWVATHCPPGTYPEQWDVEGLKDSVEAVLGLQPPIDDWLQEEAVEQEAIAERLQQQADQVMSDKIAGADPQRWIEIEKSLLLQTLDHNWKEHLATLDALRQVIHLRSFAQKKPIDEYKQEAFLLFERLLVTIREEVTRTLMRAQITIQDPAPPPLPDFITTHFDPLSGDDDTMDFDTASIAGLGEAAPRAAPLPPMPEGASPPESRNALCPCGSGRKFKHCHGALA